ncbi:MAG: hypothetical protein JWO86_8652 [Myxococcaceae bacterium]|nr:hypothetical protein [Myxococcaceae bacterium]
MTLREAEVAPRGDLRRDGIRTRDIQLGEVERSSRSASFSGLREEPWTGPTTCPTTNESIDTQIPPLLVWQCHTASGLYDGGTCSGSPSCCSSSRPGALVAFRPVSLRPRVLPVRAVRVPCRRRRSQGPRQSAPTHGRQRGQSSRDRARRRIQKRSRECWRHCSRSGSSRSTIAQSPHVNRRLGSRSTMCSWRTSTRGASSLSSSAVSEGTPRARTTRSATSSESTTAKGTRARFGSRLCSRSGPSLQGRPPTGGARDPSCCVSPGDLGADCNGADAGEEPQEDEGPSRGLFERDTGFEPATSSLGSWHSTN